MPAGPTRRICEEDDQLYVHLTTLKSLLSGSQRHENVLPEVVGIVCEEGKDGVGVVVYLLQLPDGRLDALSRPGGGESRAVPLQLNQRQDRKSVV